MADVATESQPYQASEDVVDMEDEEPIPLPVSESSVAQRDSASGGPAPIAAPTNAHAPPSATTTTTTTTTITAVPNRPPTGPAAISSSATAGTVPPKKRPRLDLTGSGLANATSRTSGGERRKGKSIFGMVIGTLNKAKIEDKERMASEAAKKRQSIDARLQAKLAKEQSLIRKQDEAKRDRLAAIRKEEDLSVKDGILKYRYTVLPQLSNFLLTTDVIRHTVPAPGDPPRSPSPPLSSTLPHPPATSHPPALYYLPKILTPSQELFIAQRRKQAGTRVREEKEEWDSERQKGIEVVRELRQKSAAQLALLEAVKESEAPADESEGARGGAGGGDGDEEMASVEGDGPPNGNGVVSSEPAAHDAAAVHQASTDAMDQDDDDAVEY